MTIFERKTDYLESNIYLKETSSLRGDIFQIKDFFLRYVSPYCLLSYKKKPASLFGIHTLSMFKVENPNDKHDLTYEY